MSEIEGESYHQESEVAGDPGPLPRRLGRRAAPAAHGPLRVLFILSSAAGLWPGAFREGGFNLPRVPGEYIVGAALVAR